MTLAAIFLWSVLCSALIPHALEAPQQDPAQSTPPAPQASEPAQSSKSQTESQPPSAPAKPPNAASHKPASSSKKKSRHKKEPEPCAVAPADTQTPATTTATAPTVPADDTQSAATKPTSNCPPPKIVVRQGGSIEPVIQLAGGAGGTSTQAAQAQAVAKPMLDATEENLKKLAERQLSTTEQDMVAQIKQYMDQSKTAATTGDAERARTLAWKAQTLSEDLVKPPK